MLCVNAFINVLKLRMKLTGEPEMPKNKSDIIEVLIDIFRGVFLVTFLLYLIWISVVFCNAA